MSDKSLCKESVYASIFRDYAPTLFNYLYYKCGNEDLAKDLTQDAFTKLWQHCESINYTTAKGYVFKTANNLLINHYKRETVSLKFKNVQKKEYTSEHPAYLLEEKELHQQLEQAISNLPEKQRIAFLLSRIDKKTYAEIANILNISRQAVEKRIYNALNTLRKISSKIK